VDLGVPAGQPGHGGGAVGAPTWELSGYVAWRVVHKWSPGQPCPVDTSMPYPAKLSRTVAGFARCLWAARRSSPTAVRVGVGIDVNPCGWGGQGRVPRDGDCVKCSAPHLGQCRNVSAARPSAEIAPTSLPSSARSTVRPRGATENMEIDRIRRRAADLGTRHAWPHSMQVLTYSRACPGKRIPEAWKLR
jgi:hypothetical protein